MKTPLILLSTLAWLLPISAQTQTTQPRQSEAKAQTQAKVQIAILLDTSDSMDGLIEQAKTQLWAVVNTFIAAKQNGQVPFVEVALYEYGNDSLDPKSSFLRQIQPLTRDLDKVSEELFKLSTNGGQEYCGAVIQRATSDLQWDKSPDVYKTIFICGNEPFTQGPIDVYKSCQSAIAQGVIVNTIHCGDEAVGLGTGWKEGATLADGNFLNIDQNKAVVQIPAPQDTEIAELNVKLNKTYLAYGNQRKEKIALQQDQDAAALSNAESGAAVQRAVTKSSANYDNRSWDLVDASKEEQFDITTVEDDKLPAELQRKTLEEKTKIVKAKATERAELQNKILDLNKQREKFIAEKRVEQTGAETLDTAVISTVREQATQKGYHFKTN